MFYYSSGNSQEYLELKPALTDRQQSLLSAFYRLSQERTVNQDAPYPIKEQDIRYYQQHYGSCHYPQDLFIMAIHEIDSEYITHRCEQMRRANKGK
jgi:hypothetical protein